MQISSKHNCNIQIKILTVSGIVFSTHQSIKILGYIDHRKLSYFEIKIIIKRLAEILSVNKALCFCSVSTIKQTKLACLLVHNTNT